MMVQHIPLGWNARILSLPMLIATPELYAYFVGDRSCVWEQLYIVVYLLSSGYTVRKCTCACILDVRFHFTRYIICLEMQLYVLSGRI
jgi:hypothetical protein